MARARPAAAAILPLALCLAAAGCEVTHTYETREFEAPRDQARAPALAVKVDFPAGGIRVHAAGADRTLYRAAVTFCAEHTVPAATLTAPAVAGAGPARLALSLAALPGVFVGFGGEHNVMRLDLAPGFPEDLDFDLGEGESVIDLAGIRLRRLRMVAGAGDARVIFGSPNDETAEEVTIEGTVGDVGVDLLGNANASMVTVTGGVGSIEVDLGGAWRRDATVVIQASVGDLTLKLPGRAASPGVRLSVGEPWRSRLALPGYRRAGDDFQSPGYDEAARRVDVRILPGIGRLHVDAGPGEGPPAGEDGGSEGRPGP